MEPFWQMNAMLFIRAGQSKGRGFPLPDGARVVIGRGADSDLQLADEGLSRAHCAIESKEDHFLLTDLESRNGTFVNGKPAGETFLSSGDLIEVGAATIEFTFETVQMGPQDARALVTLTPEREGSLKLQMKKSREMDDTLIFAPSGARETVEDYRTVHRELATIYKVSNAINAEENIDRLLPLVMDLIFEVVEADRGFLLLVDEEEGGIEPVVVRDRSGNAAKGELTLSQTIVNQCIENGMCILCPDTTADDRFKGARSIVVHSIRSVVCVPLDTQEKVLGAIYVDTTQKSQPLTEHDRDLLTAVAKQAAVAIERVFLIDRLQSMFIGSIKTLVTAIEAKDVYTFGHSDRVTSFALEVAEELGFSDKELENIELAGLLHDVGKIAVKEAILRKEGQLTPEERKAILTHPEWGAKIVSNINSPNIDEVVKIVRHHHERWDGSGYPDGLKGEETPAAARLLAVADAFDAMTSDRPYRRKFVAKEVLDELRKCAGVHFDPAVINALFRRYTRGRIGVRDAPEGEPGGTSATVGPLERWRLAGQTRQRMAVSRPVRMHG